MLCCWASTRFRRWRLSVPCSFPWPRTRRCRQPEGWNSLWHRWYGRRRRFPVRPHRWSRSLDTETTGLFSLSSHFTSLTPVSRKRVKHYEKARGVRNHKSLKNLYTRQTELNLLPTLRFPQIFIIRMNAFKGSLPGTLPLLSRGTRSRFIFLGNAASPRKRARHNPSVPLQPQRVPCLPDYSTR